MKSNLPHIFIPEINANFLIDTGSTRSLINPELAYKFYPNNISNENFVIQTAHNLTQHNEVATIPIFKIFNMEDNHKFYLFNFSDRYDGIIGIDLLRQLNANINVNNNELSTPKSKIPIIFNPETDLKNSYNFSITIEPRTQKVIKVPVKQNKGIGILNYYELGKGVQIPKSLVNIVDNFAITTVTNINETPMKIDILEPFEIEPINLLEVNFANKMDTENKCLNPEQDKLQRDNIQNIRLQHCNDEERNAITKLCFKYRDIFHCENIPLSFTNSITHKIDLKNDSPIYTKSYRFPEVHKQEVKDQISKMLDQGIIQNSFSPWSSPIWVVPKKLDASGRKKWRLVIDYRKLNEHTVDDKYPLPNISDILDKLGKANYFSTIDLASGFHQIEVDPQDIPKTAFTTEGGHYEFKRMPFGLKNAPSTFQRVMDNVLRGLQNEICVVYLDDILIYSTSLQEHIERLTLIFKRLREHNFKIQLDKSEFLRKEVSYLGHVVTPEGVRPNPDKITAIKNFPIPKTQKEIKSFLGLLGYYRRFIKNLAKITKPLTRCLKKDGKIIHDQEFVNCFNTCKNILTNDPVLQYPDFTKPFILTTDASNFAIGAVLSQGEIPQDRPVAYASRTLNDTETRYSTIEKELLAIIWACKYFRPYLYGRKFKIYTDHRPLMWLHNLKEPNSKLMRWRLRLEEFDYQIIYKKGKFNTNADCLSRISINALENESIINNPGDVDENILEYLRELSENVMEQNHPIPGTSNDNKIKILSDIQIQPTLMQNEDDHPISTTQHSNANEFTNDGIKIYDEIINNKTNQIIVIPNPYHTLQIKRENYENQKIVTVKIPKIDNYNLILQFLKENTQTNNVYCIYFHTEQFYQDFCKVYLENFSQTGPKLIRCLKRVNTVTDIEEQILIIQNHHLGKTNHRGINETLDHLKKNYYWKNMKKSVSDFINSCDTCQRSKYARKTPYVPLMLTETASKPFQIVHIDVFTFDGKNYLTLVDAFSKFAQAIYISGKTAINIAQALIHYFTSFGVPQNLTADKGTEFNNEVIKELLKLHKLNVHFTTTAHHESNGIVERFHSTIIEHLRILRELYPDEIDLINYAIIGYNNSIHSSTGYTPFELTFGHTELRDPNEIFLPTTFYNEYTENHKEKLKHVYQQVSDKIISKKEKITQQHNTEGEINPEFKLEQTVFKINPTYRNKKDKKFLGPYKIIEILDRNRVKIKNLKNKIEIIHIKELKKPIVTDQPFVSSKPN